MANEQEQHPPEEPPSSVVDRSMSVTLPESADQQPQPLQDQISPAIDQSTAVGKEELPLLETEVFNCLFCGKFFNSEIAIVRHHRIRHGLTEFTASMGDDGREKRNNAYSENNGNQQRHFGSEENSLDTNGTGEDSLEQNNARSALGKMDKISTEYSVVSTSVDRNPYKCDVCDKGFSASSKLQRHFRTHTGEKPFKCDACGKEFSQASNLQRHVGTHTGEKSYKCDVCGKGFAESSNLQKHVRIHTGVKPYQCEVCGKGFNQSSTLQSHIMIHTGDLPHKCYVCGKGFIQSSHLQTHLKVHTKEKSYICGTCGKGFSQSSHLQTHLRIHTGEKPYKCHICGKGFSQSSNLQTHHMVHTGPKS